MSARAYYNEIDPYAAQWLRNLIAAGHIAPGDVDERSIVDVRPDDLAGYTQCHFFAGIGGWSYAARLAGFPDERELWTASAPCPPWSRARIWRRDEAGERDGRDLWPSCFRLVSARRPAPLFGEQVYGSSAKPWIERTEADLHAAGYNFDGRVERAAKHGGPQGRERFFFSADLGGSRRQGLVARRSVGASRPWRWRGKEDLRAIARSPFQPGRCWPQPLVRRGDDGFSPRVAALRAYGNAIDPWVAAEVIAAFLDIERSVV